MARKLGVLAATGLMLVASVGRTDINAEHGTTSVVLPSTLFTANVDNQGNITGTGSRVTVSHHESGAFCHKVSRLSVGASATGMSHPTTPSERQPNLCNFDNLTYDFAFPGVNVPSQTALVASSWSKTCQASNNSGTPFMTTHPFGYTQVVAHVSYANGDYKGYFFPAPPVKLTCQPCPQLLVSTALYLVPDQMLTSFNPLWLVGGGVPPYAISFPNPETLPLGLVATASGLLSGRPAAGVYQTRVTVKGNCKSGRNVVTSDLYMHVVAPPLLAASVAPTTVPTAGGAVSLSLTLPHYDIVSAKAFVRPSGAGSVEVPLKLAPKARPSGPWLATYNAPANPSAQPLAYAVSFTTTGRNGVVASVTATASFQVAGRPAPPTQLKPGISSASATR